MIRIALIAAVAENGVIGRDNKLPWHIKSEWQYFVRMTKGKPVILGRRTFDSIGEPLKDRPNIVVTRHPRFQHEGVTLAFTLESAIEIGKKIAADTGKDEVMVAGGTEIYKQALPLADRLYLTEVHMRPEGDAKFPAFDRKQWIETQREFHKAKEGETANYTITVLDRRR